MKFDNVLETLLESLRGSGTVNDDMRAVIRACTETQPHPDWATFAKMDFQAELDRLRAWLPTTPEAYPAGDTVRGLWFDIFSDEDETTGEPICGLSLAGTTRYSDSDPSWVESTTELWDTWGPFEVGSDVLTAIYRLAYATDISLMNDADYPLCLAYAVFAVKYLLSGMTVRSISSTTDRLGIAVGFHDGDILILGELTTSGLVLNPRF